MTMRPIRWLHISDIHMRETDPWSRDSVLLAMREHISRNSAEDIKVDFILVTGDLAFSGIANEYRLVGKFFDALSTASRVPKESIYCIPGNHDLDRGRNKMCFIGARKVLQNQSEIDAILAGQGDLETLITRQKNYRNFQETYFSTQERNDTDDGLGYVSRIALDDIQVAIIGLNSAWLAEGGLNDHGKILIGERQVINAFDWIKKHDQQPHIIIGMAHHPLHLLCEFDRNPVQNRIERFCHFFHCGHLHQPETRTSGLSGTGCLTLGAGASFESRQSHNSYSIVTLDLLQALRTVDTVKFDPNNSVFSSVGSEKYPIEVEPANVCSVEELAKAMVDYSAFLNQWPHYFSALLLGQKSDILITTQNNYTFGSFAVLQAEPTSDLQEKTANFMKFKNLIPVLYKRNSFEKIFYQYGYMIGEYESILEQICNAQPTIRNRLLEYENDARKLVNFDLSGHSPHIANFLHTLANERDWEILREQAQRHLDSSDSKLATHAKKMLAISLANSHELEDKTTAISIYQSLMESNLAEFNDVGNLAILFVNIGRFDEAKNVILFSIEHFPVDRRDYFFEIGQQIVKASGDRKFRDLLVNMVKERKS